MEKPYPIDYKTIQEINAEKEQPKQDDSCPKGWTPENPPKDQLDCYNLENMNPCKRFYACKIVLKAMARVKC